MDLRHRGHQTHIPFIGDQTQSSGFCNGKIGPADPHLRCQISGSEFLPGNFDQFVDIFRRLFFSGDILEQIAHLIPGKVNGRHHHVGRPLFAKLDNPFTQIGLRYRKPLFF